MIDILLCVLIVLSSYSLGRVALRLLSMNCSSSTYLIPVVTISVGLATLACITFAIASVGILYTWVAYLLITLPLLLYIGDASTVLGNAKKLTLAELCKPFVRNNWFAIGIAVLTGFCIIYSLLSALMPSMFGDDITYRLEIAKRFAQSHRLVRLTDIPESGLPIMIEMLYTLAILLHGPILANLIHFTMGLLVLLTIYVFVRERWGVTSALMSVAIVAVAPVFGWLSSVAYAELGLALYQLLAVMLFFEWMQTREEKLLWLVGVMLGIGLGIGYGTIITLVFLTSILLLIAFHKELIRPGTRTSVTEKTAAINGLQALLIWMAIIAAPWYLQSCWASGSPIYPYFVKLVIRPDIAKLFVEKTTMQSLPDYGLGSLLMLPWTVIVSAGTFSGIIGPTVLLLTTCMFFIERVPKTVKLLLIYAVFYLICLWISMPESKFIVPALATCAIAAGWTYHTITFGQKNSVVRSAFSCVVLLSLLVSRLDAGMNDKETSQLNWPRAKVVLHIADYSTYMTDTLGGTWDVSQYINHRLPRKAKILGINERRELYCSREYVCDDYLRLYQSKGSSAARFANLRKLGITHILHVTMPGTSDTTTIEKDLAAGLLKSEYASRGVQLLSVQYAAVDRENKKEQDVKNGKRQHHSANLQS